MFPSLFFLLTFLTIKANSLLVKDWGTGSYVNRLAYSTYDVVKEAFNLVTAAQKEVFPIEDMQHTYFQEWNNMNATVDFHAYNGWLEELVLESRFDQIGHLRRFIINRSARTSMSRGSQHELFTCAGCLALAARRIHYAFESSIHKHETVGIIENGPVSYEINFQMTVITAFNKTTNQHMCYTNLEPLVFHLETKSQLTSKVEGVGIFNFLADTLDQWMYYHFNDTIRVNIQKRMDLAMRKVLGKRNVCDQFLSL